MAVVVVGQYCPIGQSEHSAIPTCEYMPRPQGTGDADLLAQLKIERDDDLISFE